MPNTRRRRRFSFQNDINDSRSLNNSKNEPHTSKVLNASSHTRPQQRNGDLVNSSKNLPITINCNPPSSIQTVKSLSTTKPATITLDKDVTTTGIEVTSVFSVTNDTIMKPFTQKESSADTILSANNSLDSKHIDKDNKIVRKEKPRQHKAKIRSPKCRVTTTESQTKTSEKTSIGSEAIDWNHEIKIINFDQCYIAETPETSEADGDRSNKESDHNIMCRICHGGESLNSELGPLISACSCRGTVGRVHVKCLEHWLTESGKSRCELCGIRYATRRVHRYGVPRALLMWILSQNAKQLMVDSLGIVLMSPLAILAAWLSGRTLAGLMMQESHVAPWPLASTFVLACMTLVCYYCWIVSAATRHALGWWMWYRSQYEVRLELESSED